MDRFLENAARILEGGRSAVQAGCTSSAWTVLIAREGGIRMVADSDWPLDSLAREAGAEMAYRVSVNGTHVAVVFPSGDSDGANARRFCFQLRKEMRPPYSGSWSVWGVIVSERGGEIQDMGDAN